MKKRAAFSTVHESRPWHPCGWHAHAEASHVPGAWLQVHHLEEAYYEKLFRGGLTDATAPRTRLGTPRVKATRKSYELRP